MLSACEFTGVADLATPVSDDSFGINYMNLRSGKSTLVCTGTTGQQSVGTFDLNIQFDDLQINQGVGNGTGRIEWEDGAETEVEARAEYYYPHIYFSMIASAGPFESQTGFADLQGWSVSTVGDGGPITSLHFLEPTPMVIGNPES